MKKIFALFIVCSLIYTLYYLTNYFALFKKNKPLLQSDITSSKESQDKPIENVSYELKEVVRDLYVPWSISFTGNNRILVTERNGKLREVVNNILNPTPLITFNVSEKGEEGLMGLAADPNYETNKYLYVCYAYESRNGLVDTVVRLKDNITDVQPDKTLIDNIPAAQYHAGCRIKFGPDGKLYITTGDATQKSIAQDLNSLGGKILRINNDGSIPEDNPFKDSMIYSYGHRNPQGISWDNSTDTMLEVEHGPSLIDGPAGGDEVNKIIPGENYGWPLVSHDRSIPNARSPLITFTPAVAPSDTLIYSGKLFPQFKAAMFFGGLKGEGLYRVDFIDDNFEEVSRWDIEVKGLGRIREVVESPNGEIYFTTSNRDGRGKPKEGDDKIYKLTPVLK